MSGLCDSVTSEAGLVYGFKGMDRWIVRQIVEKPMRRKFSPRV